MSVRHTSLVAVTVSLSSFIEEHDVSQQKFKINFLQTGTKAVSTIDSL